MTQLPFPSTIEAQRAPRFKKREDCMVSWRKQGEYNAQRYQKSELCGFKWANIHNKCAHESMRLANSSPNTCLMWPTFGPELKFGTKFFFSSDQDELA